MRSALFALFLALLPTPALADTSAKLTAAGLGLALVDATQTCITANPKSPWRFGESASPLASGWILGQHPSCGATYAWVMGNSALYYLLLPHNKLGNALRLARIGFEVYVVGNNAALEIQFHP